MHFVAYIFFNFQTVGINDSEQRRVDNCLKSQKVDGWIRLSFYFDDPNIAVYPRGWRSALTK
jgi:hypothetical protein